MLLNKLKILFRLLWLIGYPTKQHESEQSRMIIAEKVAQLIYSKSFFSEYGRIWLDDKDFFKYYTKFQGKNYHSADRKFFQRSLLNLVENLPGDTAECGVCQGATSWLICDKFKNTDKVHYAFDSFEGLSTPVEEDGKYWQKGDLYATEEVVKKNLEGYKLKLFRGWIPEKFESISDCQFCFVHIDVDLYEPTLASLQFFYPRMVAGGIILCDDYGFSTCPGAKKAFDEYMNDKPEKIIHVPTAQGFIIKN